MPPRCYRPIAVTKPAVIFADEPTGVYRVKTQSRRL